jgi:hypothetical protein
MKKELQSKDFRIGNFVLHTHIAKDGFVEYAQIFGVIKGHIYIDDHRLPEYACILAKEISPLRITHDWLLKFGFVVEYCNSTNVYKYFLPNTPFGYLQGVFNVFTQTGCFSVKIEHVHELQNLYFALTGEELELKNVTP